MSDRKLSLLALNLFASVFLLFSVEAFATLTYSQSSGSSAVDLTDPTKPIIYGGFAGTCPTTDTVCDSCQGTVVAGTGLTPCNHNNVTPSMKLSIVINSSAALKAIPDVKIGSVSVGSVAWTAGATSFTVSVTWSDLCNNAPTNADSQCAKDTNFDLVVTTTQTGTTGGSDSLTFKIVTRYADTTATGSSTWNYIDCPLDQTDSNTQQVGFCHFSVFPGDGKVYANDLSVSSTFPTSNNSAANFINAIFFYEEQTTADGGSDAATIARITNKSPTASLGVNTTASPPVADDRIDGLTNGTRYCMIMASQDATGVITYFTPTSGTGAVAATTLCTTPETVAGLLDDKHCFIATAAFGSEMAPEVQSFRDFRNKFLLPFSGGRKFVKLYYKYSPKYATMISQSETAKMFVRGLLWPLLFFARMSVAFGFWVTLIVLALAVGSLVELYRRLILGSQTRGEL